MTTPQLLIVCLTLLLIVAAILVAFLQAEKAWEAKTTEQPRLVEPGAGTVFGGLLPAQQVAIHTGPGQMVTGAIQEVREGCALLTGAVVQVQGAQDVKMPGITRVSLREATVVQELMPPTVPAPPPSSAPASSAAGASEPRESSLVG